MRSTVRRTVTEGPRMTSPLTLTTRRMSMEDYEQKALARWRALRAHDDRAASQLVKQLLKQKEQYGDDGIVGSPDLPQDAAAVFGGYTLFDWWLRLGGVIICAIDTPAPGASRS